MKALAALICVLLLAGCAIQSGTLTDKAQQEAMEAQQKEQAKNPPSNATSATPAPTEQAQAAPVAPAQTQSQATTTPTPAQTPIPVIQQQKPITMTAPTPPKDTIPNLSETLKEAQILMDEQPKAEDTSINKPITPNLMPY